MLKNVKKIVKLEDTSNLKEIVKRLSKKYKIHPAKKWKKRNKYEYSFRIGKNSYTIIEANDDEEMILKFILVVYEYAKYRKRCKNALQSIH